MLYFNLQQSHPVIILFQKSLSTFLLYNYNTIYLSETKSTMETEWQH